MNKVNMWNLLTTICDCILFCVLVRLSIFNLNKPGFAFACGLFGLWASMMLGSKLMLQLMYKELESNKVPSIL